MELFLDLAYCYRYQFVFFACTNVVLSQRLGYVAYFDETREGISFTYIIVTVVSATVPNFKPYSSKSRFRTNSF